MNGRISPPRLADLPPASRGVYDRITATRGWAPAIFAVGLHSPVLVGRLASVGEFLREDSVLDVKTRELATLAVARQTKSVYEWTHHLSSAEEAGVERDLLERLAAGVLEHDPRPIGAVVRFARRLAAGESIDDESVATIKGVWGDQGLVELTILASYYLGLARLGHALNVRLEPGIAPREFTYPAGGGTS